MFLLNHDNMYCMEIGGIKFVCESVQNDYEFTAKKIAACYKNKLINIVEFMLDDIIQCYGVMSSAEIIALLDTPFIDLDRSVLTYLEHSFDAIHIFEIEFGGYIDELYYYSIYG